MTRRSLTPAQQALVTDTMPLVSGIAGRVMRTCPPSIDREDLHQLGSLGLIEAAAMTFRPASGVPFGAFARQRIRGAMIDGLRASSWPKRLRAARRDGTGNAEVQQRIAVLEALACGQTQSALLMAPALLGVLTRPLPSPEESAVRSSTVAAALSVLSPRDRYIVARSFLDEIDLKAIGRELGVKESRVSQLRTRALARIRAALSEHPSQFGEPTHA